MAKRAVRRIERKFGWKPDLPDIRDYQFCALRRPAKAPVLPKQVDLRALCSPVEDQLTSSSCVGNSTVGGLELLLVKNKKPFTDLSRFFVYYNARVLGGNANRDTGCYIRNAIKTLAKEGCCSEKLWPFLMSRVTTQPNSACYKDAKSRVVTQYARLSTLLDMRVCLADGFPFVFGFTVYESFMSDAVAKSGVGNLPKKNDKPLGGHAVLAVGYDDASKRVLVRNSWGPGWGQKGYFTLPYAYLESRELSDDVWTIRAGTGL